DRENLSGLVQLELFSRTKHKKINEFDSTTPPELTMSWRPFVNFTPTPNIRQISDPTYPKGYTYKIRNMVLYKSYIIKK
ncbi:MAG: hypothetical protein NWS22_12260, partial [Porticoccaceae bacterium]|nr:hypothetical protein [Porticoccaceae bacterium]